MELKNKNVLVTGANGFVGSFLAEELIRKGANVSCLVRKTSNLRWLKDTKVKLVYGEITDKKSLHGNFKDTEYVFHCAGIKEGKNKEAFMAVNHIGTKNLVETVFSESSKLKKFVNIGSMAVMGPGKNGRPISESHDCNPVTFYGESKLKGEQEVLKFAGNIPVVSLRPPAIYGPRDEDIHMMFNAVKFGIKPVFGFRKRLVSMCYVKDLISASLLSAVKEKANGNTYIIADGNIDSWDDILRFIAKELKKRSFTVRVPVSVVLSGAFLSELFAVVTNRSTIFTRQKAREMMGYWGCDISKAKKDLGFEPKYDVSKGIHETARWYKSNNWI